MKSNFQPRLSLQFKLAVTASVTSAMLATLLVIYYSQHLEIEARLALTSRAVAIASALASESEYGLLAGNKPLLQRNINSVLTQADVIYARLYDDHGRLLVSAGHIPESLGTFLDTALWRGARAEAISSYRTDPHIGVTQLIHMPVTLQPASVQLAELPDDDAAEPRRQAGQFLGVVELCVSPMSTLQRVDTAQRASLGLAIASAVLASMLCVVVVRRVTRPLRELVHGTELLAAGKLDTRVTITSRDEIGDLGKAFNQMAISLEHSRQVILNHQHELEQRVSERTAELKESRDFFNAVISESPTPMWILDSTGHALLCNKALRTLFGIADDTLPPSYCILEDLELSERGHLPTVQRTFREGQTVHLSTLYDAWRVNHSWAPALRPLSLEFTLFPLRDQAGVVKNVIAILTNLTHERQMEAQLRQADKMAAVGQLGAGVAHEINNPLTGILGYAQLMLQKTPEDHPFRRQLEVIEREAQRCKQIVINLLAYSRPADDTIILGDLQSVIGHAVELMHHQAELHNIKIDLHVPTNLPKIRLNANQLQQVFVNILANACDVMPQGGSILISCGVNPESKSVRVRFSDTGPGIPENNLDRIFEPFFTTKENWRGTGLGLTVSYKIVQDHGGRIFVRNRPEGGAEFTLDLPLPAS